MTTNAAFFYPVTKDRSLNQNQDFKNCVSTHQEAILWFPAVAAWRAASEPSMTTIPTRITLFQLWSHYTNYDHTIPTVIRDVATNHRAGANWSHKTDTELPQRRFPSFQWSTTLVNYSAKLTYWRLIKLSLTKAGKLVSLELLMSLFESSASFDLFHNDFNQSFVSTLGTWRRKSVSNNLFGAPHYLFLDHF